MPAPTSNIKWSSEVNGKGRLGIYAKVTENTNTSYVVNIQVWFWTNYGCVDSGNTFYYNASTSATSATTSQGSVSINHTVSSGGAWSTSNQTKILDKTYTYTKSTSDKTVKVYAKLTNIDYVGATISVNDSFSIPALTSYTVEYNLNGGSGTFKDQTKYYGQTLKLSTSEPTRTGHTFQGWGLSASDTTVDYNPGDNYTANAGDELFAIWKANTYVISYDLKGGSGSFDNQTKTYGVTLKLHTTKPTKTNYTFKGWDTSSAATTVKYTAGDNYTTNSKATLYAVWELAYKKPSITSYSVGRTSAGTSATVKFNWSTFNSNPSLTIVWKEASASSYPTANKHTETLSGTSGTGKSVTIGGDALSVDKSYTIKVTITDSGGSSDSIKTLNSQNFPIDFLSGGTGTAIGKAAEETNKFDVGYDSVFRKLLSVSDGVKMSASDGKQGVLLSSNGNVYVQAQNGAEPSMNLYLPGVTDSGCRMVLGSDKYMNFYNALYYRFGSHVIIANAKSSASDGKGGFLLTESGVMSIQAADGGHPSINFYRPGETSYTGRIVLNADKYLRFMNSNLYDFDNSIDVTGNVTISDTVQPGVRVLLGFSGVPNASHYVGTYWADGSHHYILERNTNGLSTNLGWAGSTDYKTITTIRGQTCRYTNSSGTTNLSDERLKKDFTSLEKWDEFYNSIEPLAFRMKSGASGRYHMGFKAQQVEKALTDSGLTTKDFAGFVKLQHTSDIDDPEGNAAYEAAGIKDGDDEYGLIYTEFVALNTYQIQKLQKENKELKDKLNALEERLLKMEAALGIQNEGV